MSLGQLAAKVGYTRDYVGRAERPLKGLPSDGLVTAIDNVLRAEGALVELRMRAAAEEHSRRAVRQSDPASNDDLIDQAHVARELRRYREQAGLSITQLANHIGYTRTYVSNCEKPGAGLVSANVVERIDNELGALIELRQKADANRQARQKVGRATSASNSERPAEVAPESGLQDPTATATDDSESTAILDRLADPVIIPCHTNDGGITYLTLSRREFLKVTQTGVSAVGATVAVSALSRFAADHPFARLEHRPRRTTYVTGADVEDVRNYTRTFRELDNKFGGGHAHALATQFLESDVATMLRGTYAEAVGEQLFVAAAQLAHLAAWTAYDMGMHDRAQSYFGQALDLAVGAGDHAFCGEVLAAKGHQAIHLNNPRQAIELARASRNAAKKAAVPLLLAEAYVLEANAHAALGESKECAYHLSRAEDAFTNSRSSEVPDWLRYFDEGYFAARIAHCLRDAQEFVQARTFALQAIDMSNGLTRTRAFNNIILATTHVQTDLEEACSIGIDALDVAVRLQSSRLIRYIGDFRDRLDISHGSEPAVNQFTENVAESLRRN